MTINVGFTGTREGMSQKQLQTLWAQIADIKAKKEPIVFHHGGCRGADLEAAKMFSNVTNRIWCLPGDSNQHLEAQKRGEITLAVKPYLERNKNIVTLCDFLIAAPLGPEIARSGTWMTVRYARAMGKPYLILER